MAGITGYASRILVVTGKNMTSGFTKGEKNQSLAGHRNREAWVLLLGLFIILLPSILSAQSGDKPAKEKQEGTTKLRIEVTAGSAGDAVEGASVYVRYTTERKFGKDKKIEQNWKTNKEGILKVPEVPRGKVLIQVIAQGWKTFGQWYDVDQDEQTIKIHLQKPPHWY
jgi:hypothetical protein